MTNAASPAALLINGRTAGEWVQLAAKYRANAQRSSTSAQESWERSDTDGFLSQWASDSMARQYEASAAWADAQGWGEANVLTNLTGDIVSLRSREGEWGRDYWVLNDAEAARFGKRFLTEPAGNNWKIKAERLRAKGFILARAIVPTHTPKLTGGAGSLSVWSEPKWDDVRAMIDAGTLEMAHTDWLMKLSEMWDADNQADDIARATPSDKATAAKPAVKRASGSHADCTHEATKAGRAACRKARS